MYSARRGIGPRRFRDRGQWRALLAALVVVLAGCTPKAAVNRDSEPSVLPLPLEAGAYFNAVWLRSGWVAVEYSPPDSDKLFTPLWKMTSYENVTELPDGRLGLVRACLPENEVDPSEYTMLAYSMERRSLETLTTLSVRPGPYAWEPTLTRGLFSRSSDICAGIGGLSRSGAEPLAITVSDGDKSWRVDAHLNSPPDEPCDDEGRAKDPGWSPDGSTIAFLASPQSIAVKGRARLKEPWNLYLMGSNSSTPRPVLRSMSGPTGPLWSPDSRSLAFSADIPGEGRGAFLLTVADGKLRQVAGGEISVSSWSPDNTRLLAIRTLSKSGQWPPRTELVTIQL